MSCMGCEKGERVWRTPDAIHIDVRDLEPPEPMVAILTLIDSGQVDTALIAHLDREPVFLYPELDDRGWGHEIVESSCGSPCGDVQLRLVRLAPVRRWLGKTRQRVSRRAIDAVERGGRVCGTGRA